MSALYLLRHGQAGTRDHYDTLSEVGLKQSRLLGEYLAGQNTRFAAIYAGALERQRRTAEEVCRAYCRAGVPAPAIVEDPGWNEFDLTGVYQALAPHLSAENPEFRRDYERMEGNRAEVDRRWTSCDMAVVRAWIEGRYPFEGESWRQFYGRITGRLDSLRRHGSGESIAVFTSATPMAIVVATALGLADGMTMKLAGVTYNSAITTLRVEPRDLTLFLFNGVPHLADPALRSFR